MRKVDQGVASRGWGLKREIVGQDGFIPEGWKKSGGERKEARFGGGGWYFIGIFRAMHLSA